MKLVFDIETNGFIHERLSVLHCIVTKNLDTNKVSKYYGNSLIEGIEKLRSAKMLIGHNIIKYDIEAIKFLYGIDVLDKGARVFDTLIGSQILFSNIYTKDLFDRKVPNKLKGRHSLKSWGYRLGFLKGDYSEDTDWQEFSPEMLNYCTQDVELSERVYNVMLGRLKELPHLSEALNTEHGIWKIIARQEVHGIPFNIDKAREVYAELLEKYTALELKLKNIFPPRYRRDGQPKQFAKQQTRKFKVGRENIYMSNGEPVMETCDGIRQKIKRTEFNPSSGDDIVYWFKKRYAWIPEVLTEKGNPSTASEVLYNLPFREARDLAEYQFLEKIIGFFVSKKGAGWLALYNPKTGCIHGRVNVNGALTGRMTHNSPNLAQVPSIKTDIYNPMKEHYGRVCRSLFTVRDGYKLVGCDASSLELRVMAHYMAMYDSGNYANIVVKGNKDEGTDVHTVNQRAAGLSTRDEAKTFIYALVYGAGDKKIGTITVKGSATENALRTAGRKLRKKFMANLPAMAKLGKAVSTTLKKRKHLRGLDGRHLYTEDYKSLNTLFQSAGAVVMKKASVILDDMLQREGFIPIGKGGDDYEFLLHVHDEYQIMAKDSICERIKELSPLAITEAGKYFKFKCLLEGEASIGNDWSETH